MLPLSLLKSTQRGSLLKRGLCAAFAIIGEQNTFVFENCFQVHRATPKHVYMLKRLLSIDQIKILTFVEMLDIKFTIPSVITIIYHQVGIPEVGHTSDNTIAHLLPVLFRNDPLIALFFVEVKIQILDEIFRQVITQKRDIVVHLAH